MLAYIIIGFKKSGILLPTKIPIISYLLKKKLKIYKAINLALSLLLLVEN
jgi:hypothetical protein